MTSSNGDTKRQRARFTGTASERLFRGAASTFSRAPHGSRRPEAPCHRPPSRRQERANDHGGEQYLVSMLGEQSPWVRNVRAADGRAVIRHGPRREVVLVEIPPAERGPVIKAFLARALDARPHIPIDPQASLEAFDAIAPTYPVFRVEDAPAGARDRRETQVG